MYLGYSQGHRRLFVRSVDEIDSHPIPGTEEATTAFFSPDGASIGFHANGRLQRVLLAGGPVALVAEVDGHVAGGSWGSDDAIVFVAPTGGLSRVSASGGTPEMLTTPNLDAGELHTSPEVLPGGSAVVFVIRTGGGSSGQVAVVSVASRQVVRLLPGIGVRYSSTGHLVVQQPNGSLAVVPFDLKRLAISGAPSLLGETAEVDVLSGTYRLGGGHSLVYLTGATLESRLTFMDRQGVRNPMPAELNGSSAPALSPDGHRIAVINAAGVAVYDRAQGTLSVVAPGGGGDVSWSPDGQWIAFTRFTREDNKAGNGLYRALANGGGQEQVLHRGPFCCATWLADGRSLITNEYNSPNADFWLVSLDSARAAALFRTPSFEFSSALSPDQRWLAYGSNESGRFEVHVRSFPGPGGRWQASTDGGTDPVSGPKRARAVLHQWGFPNFSANRPWGTLPDRATSDGLSYAGGAKL